MDVGQNTKDTKEYAMGTSPTYHHRSQLPNFTPKEVTVICSLFNLAETVYIL